MLDGSFLGKSANEWEAIAATVSAVASLFSTVIVTAVAIFTFKYMRSTKELVVASKQQSEASIRQADASIKTLELMNTERRETDSFQRAVFIHSVESVAAALAQYSNVIGSSAKPWHVPDCWLLPPEWDTCRAFVGRNAPEVLEEMQELERNLTELSAAIQGFIRAPDSLWLSTVQRRMETSSRLASLQNRLNAFSRGILKPHSA